MEQGGLEGFEARGCWYGLLAPAGIPDAIVRRLNAETTAAPRAPEVARRVAEMGSPSIGGSPEEFRELIASETRKWRTVLEGGEPGVR